MNQNTRKASRTPYFVTIETERVMDKFTSGKVHLISDDPFTSVTKAGTCVRGVLWTSGALDDVWHTIWSVASESKPVRISVAGKSSGRSWGAGHDRFKTAVFVGDRESGRKWDER